MTLPTFPHLTQLFNFGSPLFLDYLNEGLPVSSSVKHGKLSAFIKNVIYSIIHRSPVFPQFERAKQLEGFVGQILSQTNVSTHTLLSSLFLMMKLSKLIELEGLAGSEFRLWTTALLISNSFHEDNAFTARSFSEVSKLPLREIVEMKQDFLELINYEVAIPHYEYLAFLESLDATYAFYTLCPMGIIHSPLVPVISRMPSPPGSPYPKGGRRMMTMAHPPSPPKRIISKGRRLHI